MTDVITMDCDKCKKATLTKVLKIIDSFPNCFWYDASQRRKLKSKIKEEMK